MRPSTAETQLTLRLPSDLKDFLASEAKKNRSSQNSEVIRAIRERMTRSGTSASNAAPAISDAAA